MDAQDEGAFSVGDSIANASRFTLDNPQYLALTKAIGERLSEITTNRGETRVATTPVISTVVLSSDEKAELAREYPEFAVVDYGHFRPGHATWVQRRRLANEWISMQAKKLTNDVVHLGGSVLSYVCQPAGRVQLVEDVCNPVAVHEGHVLSVDTYNIFQNYVAAGKDIGRELSRERYEDYLSGKTVTRLKPGQTLDKADVVCADLAMTPMSPTQFASAMIECQAKVGFGFLTYVPQMLLQDSGEICGTGVSYEKKHDELRLLYPEGAAGATSYSMVEWEPWLISHTFSIGKFRKRHFQVELLKNRGPFMFFRMTALNTVPAVKEVSHALDLPSLSDQYLVSVPELVAPGADPALPESWKTVPFFARKRLVDRTYQFAMQTSKESFTRFGVRKYIGNTNDRVTVNGTSVKVNSRLGLQTVNRLMIAVYTRAFVDRYHAGTLLAEVMAQARDLMEGGASSAMWLARFVTWTGVPAAISAFGESVRDVSDWVRKSLDVKHRPGVGSFSDVQPYVRVQGGQFEPGTALASDNILKLALGHDAASEPKLGLPGATIAAAAASTVSVLERAAARAWQPLSFRIEDVSPFPDKQRTELAQEFADAVAANNDVQAEVGRQRAVELIQAVRVESQEEEECFVPHPDPVGAFTDMHREACEGVAVQDKTMDTASISLDPQDRSLTALYLRMPAYFGLPPGPRKVYLSKIKALNVPKRQGTLQELLSAQAARNLDAPQISLPQDEEMMAREVWERFLDEACVPNARELLANYQTDPVALSEDSLKDWAGQVSPERVASVKRDLEVNSKALADMSVEEYLVMLKADVKPSLSTKPNHSRTEPQVIVYHERALTAFYSSVFRVLVRRFLSLLLPNYHVNLLKDTRDIEGFIRGVHPFGEKGLKYLENDFSKYDKSQGRFVFILESYVFQQLGMNEQMLDKWFQGHVHCQMRSVSLGLSLHVDYQRKTGDATTAFGNVILNIVSVTYAYAGTKVKWAVFMGDDSLVCATKVGNATRAVAILMEVFNLGAKMYITDAPYYASNFVLIDDVNEAVALLPDPVKRAERWSMALDAGDPQWRERWVSARDSMSGYMNLFNTSGLAEVITQRYPVSLDTARGAASAVATVVSDFKAFRSMWESEPEVLAY